MHTNWAIIVKVLLVLWIILGSAFLIQDYLAQESKSADVQSELEKDIASSARRENE